MEGSDGSPPQSLCMIRAAELFPKHQMEKEDIQLTVPFHELAGESIRYLGRTDDGILALSNYRLFLLKTSTNSETSVPLGLIEFAQARDLFHIIINCKDASTVKCSFETAEQCSEWHRRIQLSVGVPESLESLFAFPFYSWTCDGLAGNGSNGEAEVNGSVPNLFGNDEDFTSFGPEEYLKHLKQASRYEDDFMHEVERLGFDLNGSWRISYANEKFKLCSSYPQKILVPCCITDETLQTVANFRGSRRLPAVVWRHEKNGAVIARCSQPEVGWLGWRNTEDEQLLKALADACAFDRGEQMRKLNQAAAASTFSMSRQSESESAPSSPDGSQEEVAFDEVRKILIVDARSYTSAVTNRARGGGCECIEYYPCAEIEFMNLGNIHVIRKSFHALRQLCASPPDVPNWLGMLEKTLWLQHLSGLLAASVTVCHAIEKKGRPVLVHCSDGWDRTPQIVATAQLCLDPYYRTVEGFRILVEREWLSYGHKFADRCGHGPSSDEQNERCPVFLQWLDLVHQIHKQFTCSFEFSMGYLIKLAQHSLSCLFGTFLCNTLKERIENSVFERTFSVWPFLSSPLYRNPLYVANREKVLWPAYNLRDLSLWTEVYLGSLGNKNSSDFSPNSSDNLQGYAVPMTKTRSYGDFITSGIILNGISRRSSDPNMAVDPNLTINSCSDNNSTADIQSERDGSPDFIANIINDTTKKLQNLTIELNNHDNNFAQFEFKPNCDKTLEYSEVNSVEFIDDKNDMSNLSRIKKLTPYQNNMQEEFSENQAECSALLTKMEDNIIKSTTASVHINPPPDLQKTDCEKYSLLSGIAANSLSSDLYCTVPSNSSAITKHENISVLPSTTLTADETQTSFNGVLNSLNDIGKWNKSEQNHGEEGIFTIHATTGSINLDLMHSVDLSEPTNGCSITGDDSEESIIRNSKNFINTEDNQNLWHGSVNTSTDTLVPIEDKRIVQNGLSSINGYDDIDGVDGAYRQTEGCKVLPKTSATYSVLDKVKQMNNSCNNDHNILPKVHSKPNTLATLTTAALTNFSLSQTPVNKTKVDVDSRLNQVVDQYDVVGDDNKNTTITPSCMEESILILPEHQRLDISIGDKCESNMNNIGFAIINNGTTNTYEDSSTSAEQIGAAAMKVPSSAKSTAFNFLQRRRRTLSSNSRRDFINNGKPVNGGSNSKFSIPSVRSLPLTPPGQTERSSIAITCPDGLAHALSEQNIRLQQIVHEHKLRESVLLREIHDMRMALLRKTCPNCNNAAAFNDEQVDELLLNELERKIFDCSCVLWLKYNKIIKCHPRRRHCQRSLQPREFNGNDYNTDDDDDEGLVFFGSSSASACSAVDNIENVSICSWEAVEDRSVHSSCTSSSIQPNGTSVLWVPDHAVSRCTSCQTEFWLGRRKHHCRSCGQIFCADCSEFWAPLPDAKLFSPVRVCGPCYHSVTMRMQLPKLQPKQHQLQCFKRGVADNMEHIAVEGGNALTLKTLSALALAHEGKSKKHPFVELIKNKEVVAEQIHPKISENTSKPIMRTTMTTLYDNQYSVTNIASKLLDETRTIGRGTSCQPRTTVMATKCQQQHTASIKAAAAAPAGATTTTTATAAASN